MIAATLAGPNYAWHPNHDESSIEIFTDLEDAIVALIERYHSNGRTHQMLRTLDGEIKNTLFPAFREGTTFTCYSVAGELISAPDEDQIIDAMVDVHSKMWTWQLMLSRNDEGDMVVIVTANR